MRLNGVDVFGASLTPRRHSAHKGSHGDLAIAGGAAGMSGAVLLAARAGAHCGAGRTFAALLAPSFPYDPPYPELMLRSADDFDFATAVVVAGPGMGRSAAARALLAKILQHSRPILLDADALNLVAADPALQVMVAQRRAGTVLTPHPLEAARLLQTDTAGVQADRIASARALAQRFACVAVLKGSGSVIANQHGEVLVNPSGNPALATAGSGDVLAGICGALLAQGYSAWHAAAAAVWLHGAAADALVAGGIGPIGLMAGELIPRVRSLLNELVAQRRRNAND